MIQKKGFIGIASAFVGLLLAVGMTGCQQLGHEHENTSWSVIKVATCTEKGSEGLYCDCGELLESKDIEPIGHNYAYV